MRTMPTTSTRNKESIRRDDFVICILPLILEVKQESTTWFATQIPLGQEEKGKLLLSIYHISEAVDIVIVNLCWVRYSAVPLHALSHLLFTAMTKVPNAYGETEAQKSFWLKVLQLVGHKTQIWSLGQEAFTHTHCYNCYRWGIFVTGPPRVPHLESTDESKLKTMLSFPQMKQV